MDDEGWVREKALLLIEKIRGQNQKETVRIFEAPKINFEAVHYSNLIDWNENNLTEPPLLKSLTNIELRHFARNANECNKYKINLPCHTQGVERINKSLNGHNQCI